MAYVRNYPRFQNIFWPICLGRSAFPKIMLVSSVPWGSAGVSIFYFIVWCEWENAVMMPCREAIKPVSVMPWLFCPLSRLRCKGTKGTSMEGGAGWGVGVCAWRGRRELLARGRKSRSEMGNNRGVWNQETKRERKEGDPGPLLAPRSVTTVEIKVPSFPAASSGLCPPSLVIFVCCTPLNNWGSFRIDTCTSGQKHMSLLYTPRRGQLKFQLFQRAWTSALPATEMQLALLTLDMTEYFHSPFLPFGEYAVLGVCHTLSASSVPFTWLRSFPQT